MDGLNKDERKEIKINKGMQLQQLYFLIAFEFHKIKKFLVSIHATQKKERDKHD